MTALSLADRAVVVFGGSSGIGLATARLAAELGARVTVADIAPLPDDAQGSRLRHVPCDATNHDQVASLLADIGDVDGAVTTVGGAHLATIDDLEPSVWEAQLRFNLSSAYCVARSAFAVMREGSRAGSIVTTSTGYAYLPGPDRAAYAAAKAGVTSLTRSLATAAAAHGIRVNCVAPGPTDTPRFRAMNGGDEGVARVRQQMPLGRIPEPSDVAWMNVFLLSDAARNITGQVIHVNGGIHMPA